MAVLSLSLLLTAGALIARNKILSIYAQRIANLNDRTIARLTIAMGSMLGILVTFSSVGAGAIGVTALVLLYPQLSMARIVGFDIAHAVPLTLIAGLGHGVMGSVDLHTLVSLLAGSLPGIFVGSSSACPRHSSTLCSGSSSNYRGEQACRRSFCPVESEYCGSAYDAGLQIRVRSCSRGSRYYGRNLKTTKVLGLEALANLLATPKAQLNERRSSGKVGAVADMASRRTMSKFD
jgi:hypothetical protein